MGKYMKKSKITADVGVMEVSQSTSFGVRTRAAKTLALQRLNSSSASAASVAIRDSSTSSGGPSCYLQLRSRRLEKPPILTEPKRHYQQQRSEGGGLKASGSKTREDSVNSGSVGRASASAVRSCDGEGCFRDYGDFVGSEANYEKEGFPEIQKENEAGAEASFGENNLDLEALDRGRRESTPCKFVSDPDTVATTPGSSTRRMSRTGRNERRVEDGTQRIVPTARELEEFFVYAEQQQQRLFMEKYNFDIVNDLPLAGRYEWVQVVP